MAAQQAFVDQLIADVESGQSNLRLGPGSPIKFPNSWHENVCTDLDGNFYPRGYGMRRQRCRGGHAPQLSFVPRHPLGVSVERTADVETAAQNLSPRFAAQSPTEASPVGFDSPNPRSANPSRRHGRGTPRPVRARAAVPAVCGKRARSPSLEPLDEKHASKHAKIVGAAFCTPAVEPPTPAEASGLRSLKCGREEAAETSATDAKVLADEAPASKRRTRRTAAPAAATPVTPEAAPWAGRLRSKKPAASVPVAAKSAVARPVRKTAAMKAAAAPKKAAEVAPSVWSGRLRARR